MGLGERAGTWLPGTGGPGWNGLRRGARLSLWNRWRETSALISFEKDHREERLGSVTLTVPETVVWGRLCGGGARHAAGVGPGGPALGRTPPVGDAPLASTPREGLEHQLDVAVLWRQLQTCCDLGQDTCLERDRSGGLAGLTLAWAPYQQSGPRGAAAGFAHVRPWARAGGMAGGHRSAGIHWVSSTGPATWCRGRRRPGATVPSQPPEIPV